MAKTKPHKSDPALSAAMRHQVQERGVTAVARELDVSRDAVLAVAAGAAVRAGTLALFRERLSTRHFDPGPSSNAAEPQEHV